MGIISSIDTEDRTINKNVDMGKDQISLEPNINITSQTHIRDVFQFHSIHISVIFVNYSFF